MAWTPLVAADDVAPGTVVGCEVGGSALVAWRTASGRLVASDARCPHQWSHLAAEGRVEGEQLVCLAHCWRFDPDGRGSKVNVLGRTDPKGDLVTFPVRVVDGVVEADLPASPTA